MAFITDGIWTWFNDPRAVYDSTTNCYLIGVHTSLKHNKIYRYNISKQTLLMARDLSGPIGATADDHLNPASLVLSSGKYCFGYALHPGNSYSWASKVAGSASALTLDGSSLDADRAYCRLCQTGDSQNTIWWFLREDTNPGPHSYSLSTDGTTWTTRVQFFVETGQRPYMQCFCEGNRIDFVFTQGSPDDVVCSVYHFYITMASDGNSFTIKKSDGTQVGNYNRDGSTISGTALPLSKSNVTQIYDGTSTNAWVWDLRKCNGTLTAAIATYGSASLTTPGNHNYQIATYNGSSWSAFSQVCDGGGTGNDYLYSGQPHYSGGIALNPADATKVLVSRKYGAGDFRVEEWTNSGGWSKTTDVSGNTSSVNARPTAAYGTSSAQFFYWRGTYTDYNTFSTDIWTYPTLTVGSYSTRTKPATQVWQAGSAPAGCNGYWGLVEGSGTTVADGYTTPHNGSFTGSPSWGTGTYGPELSNFSTSNYVAINPASQLVTPASPPFWVAVMFKNSSATEGIGLGFGRSSSTTPFLAGGRVNSGGTSGLSEFSARDDANTIQLAAMTGTSSNDGNYHVMMGVMWATADHRVYFDGLEYRPMGQNSLGATTLDRMTIGALVRSTVALPFPGAIVAVACGTGSVPSPESMLDDWMSGTFAAIRSAGKLFRAGSLLEGLGGVGQKAINPTLAGV